MKNALAERRRKERKNVDSIEFAELTSLTRYSVIANSGHIVDASASGFLIEVDRNHLVDPRTRSNLDLSAIIGEEVALYLPQMNLDLDGKIVRAHHIGNGVFEVGIMFSPDVPEYWRECLVDLLPEYGELDDLDDFEEPF